MPKRERALDKSTVIVKGLDNLKVIGKELNRLPVILKGLSKLAVIAKGLDNLKVIVKEPRKLAVIESPAKQKMSFVHVITSLVMTSISTSSSHLPSLQEVKQVIVYINERCRKAPTSQFKTAHVYIVSRVNPIDSRGLVGPFGLRILLVSLLTWQISFFLFASQSLCSFCRFFLSFRSASIFARAC